MSINFLRCPFCGGTDIVMCKEPNFFEGHINGYQYQVVCDASCGYGCGASSGFYDTIGEAKAAWNKRITWEKED
jgi:hypothetical protein